MRIEPVSSSAATSGQRGSHRAIAAGFCAPGTLPRVDCRRSAALAQAEDQLAPEDIVAARDLEVMPPGELGEALERVVRDVLVLVPARRKEPVERLEHPPPD